MAIQNPKNLEFDVMLSNSPLNSAWLVEQDYSQMQRVNLLRQEIFNAIEQLETSKIQSIDRQFKRILNRYQSS